MRGTTGLVIQVQAARCRVILDDSGQPIDCTVRGRLGRRPRTDKNLLVVGDHVRVERGTKGENGADGDSGIVIEILPRRNELSRRVGSPSVRHVFAANLDQALIVSSVREPALRTGFIDRCLAASATAAIPSAIVINKVDLASGTEEVADVEAVASVYRNAGFPCILASIHRPATVAAVAERLAGRITVIIGQSGVGKTSLLNAVQPGLSLRTGEVIESTGKGRHTTSHSRLIPLDVGGFVADTPGVRSFGLEPMAAGEVLLAYSEFHPFVSACRFHACSHVHEPGCGVRQAAEEGRIADWRLENYARIVGSVDG